MRIGWLAAGALGALLVVPGLGCGTDPAPKAAIRAAEAKLPLRFEPNRGQTDGRVRFLSRGAGYSLFLTQREAVLSLTKPERPATPGSPAPNSQQEQRPAAAVLRMRPLGANPQAWTSPGSVDTGFLGGLGR